MEPEKKSNGALVGLVIIIIILVLGGIYMWRSNKANMEELEKQSQALTTEDSEELNTLEQEAGMTDTNIGVNASAVN